LDALLPVHASAWSARILRVVTFRGVHAGPVVIGYDGSPSGERAMRETAPIFAGHKALVVTVYEPGKVLAGLITPTLDPVLAPIDIRTVVEIDEILYESSRQTAEQGANLICELGLEAEALAVADSLSVAETLVRLAEERDAPAIVVGAHGHRALRDLLLGSTSQEVMRHAPCPVVIVRGSEDGRS
jgi:nucleotide-binding universal stress UspA family protein